VAQELRRRGIIAASANPQTDRQRGPGPPRFERSSAVLCIELYSEYELFPRTRKQMRSLPYLLTEASKASEWSGLKVLERDGLRGWARVYERPLDHR